VLTDRPEERFEVGGTLYAEGSTSALTLLEAEPVADGPGWWLRFREVRDRTAAQRHMGTYLEAAIPADDLPAGEVYWHEVVGVPVLDLEGQRIGVVTEIYRAGEAEVLVVRTDAHGDVDVANVAGLVHEFAPRDGRIVVDVSALDLPAGPVTRRPRGRRTRRALKAASE
jgi:16S rRNA processing protein RimM